MAGWLEFEKPLLELESRIDELRSFADGQNIDVSRGGRLPRSPGTHAGRTPSIT